MIRFWVIIGCVALVVGCSSKSDDRKSKSRDGSTETSAESVAAEIREQIPRETSVENAIWNVIIESATAPRIEEFPSQTLTAIVMFATTPPIGDGLVIDHSLPPSEFIEQVMKSKSQGFGTLFQPETISDCTCTLDGDTAAGSFEFDARAFRGRVEFTAERSDGDWQLAEFRVPSIRAVTRRQPNGEWKLANDGSAHFLTLPEFYVTIDTQSRSASDVEIRLNGALVSSAELTERFTASWNEFVAAKSTGPTPQSTDANPTLVIYASPDAPAQSVLTLLTVAATHTHRVRLLDGRPEFGPHAHDRVPPIEFTVHADEKLAGPDEFQTELIDVAVLAEEGGQLTAIRVGDRLLNSPVALDELHHMARRFSASATEAGMPSPEAYIRFEGPVRYGDLFHAVAACTRRIEPDGKIVALCRLGTRRREMVMREEMPVQKLDVQIRPSTELAPATSSVIGAVAPPKLSTAVSSQPSAIRIDVGPVNVFTTNGGNFAAAVPEGTLGDGLAAGYGDAMDRITQEILNVLAKRKTLVVWLVDQSESMSDDRDEITTRIERVYTELGLSSAARGDALLTAVAGYGATYVAHTPKPTADPKEIIAALEKLPTDPSGTEMQCQAIIQAIESHKSLAEKENRQLTLILVTDESGDRTSNASQLEQAIKAAHDASCRVYVIGREAAFGSGHSRLRYVDPETKTSHWLPIDRGPETAAPEVLQTNGLSRRTDGFPSGFGPYEQSRLARQTGGIFLMMPSPEVDLVGRRADLAYDADAMRPYLPDLSARADYLAERDKSPFRKMIAQMIHDLDPYEGPYGNPSSSELSQVEVRVEGFPIDRTAFSAEAAKQIAKAEALIVHFETAQKALESVEPMRAREKSPRLRANYDLIYAQTIAYQSRLREYSWYLAEFVKTPKVVVNRLGPARPTNVWDVGTVQRLLKPDATKAARDKADALFRKIIADYAGTPWAARAEEELRRGYGIELHENFNDPRGKSVQLPKL